MYRYIIKKNGFEKDSLQMISMAHLSSKPTPENVDIT